MQVLKIAILAEKYATDYSWYVDTILELIRVGGDFVGEEVNHIIYIVDNGTGFVEFITLLSSLTYYNRKPRYLGIYCTCSELSFKILLVISSF